MTTPRMATGIPAALLVLALAGPGLAASTAKAPPARAPRAAASAKARPAAKAPAAVTPAPAAPLPAGAAGMVVGIDPETGLLGPATAEQRLLLLPEEANMLSRSTIGLVERRLPGGGVLLDLGGRFQEFSYVRMGPDGRPIFGCASDPATLRRGLTETARHPAVLEER